MDKTQLEWLKTVTQNKYSSSNISSSAGNRLVPKRKIAFDGSTYSIKNHSQLKMAVNSDPETLLDLKQSNFEIWVSSHGVALLSGSVSVSSYPHLFLVTQYD